ncbi:MAG: hypothetical protein JWN44_3542 [Myxococcales bacterium]|nr:hypothetical protein [Myxococcales bacterium]
MESVEAVAAKRRVLIDALMMCLEKSRVVQVVDAKTVRGVINSASGELWREGEFRLDPVWKILIAQPGLSAEEVAPPLLVFKAYEGELGVQVRMPQALTAIPRGEQIRLRDALGIQRQDFARAIEAMGQIVSDEQQGKTMAAIVEEASTRSAADDAAPVRRDRRERRGLAVGLTVLALGALGVSGWLVLRDTSNAFDLADTHAILQLSSGRAAGPSLTATITDPRWDSLAVADRKKVASQLMDLEAGKGIRALMLVDPNGATRAIVSETPNGRTIVVP